MEDIAVRMKSDKLLYTGYTLCNDPIYHRSSCHFHLCGFRFQFASFLYKKSHRIGTPFTQIRGHSPGVFLAGQIDDTGLFAFLLQ